jgi:predicted transglutaminase-like cysteine proteinase
MITVSIAPYDSRKLLLFLLAVISLAAASCFASSSFSTVNNTPYDRQMSRIRPVLCASSHRPKQEVSLTLVNHWIENLRAIPYGFSMEWKTPAEVESEAAADCKGKAVALYDLMHAHGADNVRLVIGKRTWMSQKTHAWLEWTASSGTYVLDPTINWSALRAEDLGGRSYIPLYAYSGDRKYRAANGTAFAQNNWHAQRLAVVSAPAAH